MDAANGTRRALAGLACALGLGLILAGLIVGLAAIQSGWGRDCVFGICVGLSLLIASAVVTPRQEAPTKP
jgi:hypothetical protein